MADCMMFPNDWHDFIKDYSFIDSEQVYTNGSELIQVFRVIQLIEHLLKEQEADIKNLNETIANLLQRITEMKMIYGDCEYVGELVRCKDCVHRGKSEKCVLAAISEEKDFPIFMLDNRGDWYCADGERKETDGH